MLWLLQCLDGESSSGESPVPQMRWIGQFLLSRLFSSLVLRSGFSWVPSLVWCLLHFWWMTSCTYDMPRSAYARVLWSWKCHYCVRKSPVSDPVRDELTRQVSCPYRNMGKMVARMFWTDQKQAVYSRRRCPTGAAYFVKGGAIGRWSSGNETNVAHVSRDLRKACKMSLETFKRKRPIWGHVRWCY
jgi:hypothetical protein